MILISSVLFQTKIDFILFFVYSKKEFLWLKKMNYTSAMYAEISSK